MLDGWPWVVVPLIQLPNNLDRLKPMEVENPSWRDVMYVDLCRNNKVFDLPVRIWQSTYHCNSLWFLSIRCCNVLLFPFLIISRTNLKRNKSSLVNRCERMKKSLTKTIVRNSFQKHCNRVPERVILVRKNAIYAWSESVVEVHHWELMCHPYVHLF